MTDLPTNWVDNAGMIEDAAFLNAVGAAVNANTHARPAFGTYSALPAAGNTGKLYFATDAGIVLRDNGTGWDVVGGNGSPAFALPATSGWSNTSLGSASLVADKGGRLLTAPSVGSGTTPLIEYRTLSPASNYAFTARVDVACDVSGGNVFGGIFLRNSASGNAVFLGLMGTSSNPYLLAAKGTPTALRASDYTYIQGNRLGYGWPQWLRFRDDGTTRYFEYSYNGLDWTLLTSSGRTDYITPDQIAWGGGNFNTGVALSVRLRSLRVA